MTEREAFEITFLCFNFSLKSKLMFDADGLWTVPDCVCRLNLNECSFHSRCVCDCMCCQTLRRLHKWALLVKNKSSIRISCAWRHHPRMTHALHAHIKTPLKTDAAVLAISDVYIWKGLNLTLTVYADDTIACLLLWCQWNLTSDLQKRVLKLKTLLQRNYFILRSSLSPLRHSRFKLRIYVSLAFDFSFKAKASLGAAFKEIKRAFGCAH